MVLAPLLHNCSKPNIAESQYVGQHNNYVYHMPIKLWKKNDFLVLPNKEPILVLFFVATDFLHQFHKI